MHISVEVYVPTGPVDQSQLEGQPLLSLQPPASLDAIHGYTVSSDTKDEISPR